jgi:hypothetical protein
MPQFASMAPNATPMRGAGSTANTGKDLFLIFTALLIEFASDRAWWRDIPPTHSRVHTLLPYGRDWVPFSQF